VVVRPRGSKGEGEKQRASALTPLRCSYSGCSIAGSSGAAAMAAEETSALGFRGRRWWLRVEGS
jgi:hypothetical protein